MKIFVEFAQSKQDLINDIKNTQHLRDEHLFKLLVYLPYRKNDYNTWCKHIWKAYHRLPITKGIRKNKLANIIYENMTNKWIDSFYSFVSAIKEELELDGYPKVKINIPRLFECFIRFHKEYAIMLATNENVSFNKTKELIDGLIAYYEES